ncbi:MAG: hypothetical protein JO356_17015 [Acidobacteria bacterium]|nr:hypothetical protein [Acidobacteriota bacterium]
MLTAANGDDGKREISIAFAVCSFDRSGKAIQYLQDKVTQKFTAEEYSSMRGLPHIIEFTPRDNASRIRLLVRDQMSGEIGSLDVPLGGTAAAKSANGARPATRPD